jgi:D-arabinose 1-dehydrogenase-like Zn-dependent alcohol dehydrogenase
MGLHVAAVDIADDKLALARASGAEVTVNAQLPDAPEQIVKQTGGGAHGVLVTAVSPAACPGAEDGSTERYRQPGRPAAGGVSHAHLRCPSQPHNHPRLDRGRP